MLIAASQFWLSRLQRKTEFEDSIVNQYRATIRPQLIAAALVHETLSARAISEQFAAFYSYLDLSNEQLFLRMHGRVRKRTWLLWSSGIQGNLERSGFRESWEAVRWRTGDFNELRLVCDTRFGRDPRRFQPRLRRLLHRELPVEKVGWRFADVHRDRWQRLRRGPGTETEREEHGRVAAEQHS